MFLAFDDNSCDEQGVREVPKESVIATWNACLTGVDDAWVAFESEWPDMAIISEDKDELNRWLKALSENGKVSDTQENMCWALAETEEEALDLLREEIAKYD